MTLIDYVLKWKIYFFLFSWTVPTIIFIYKHAFQAIIALCVVVLFFLYWKLYRRVKNSKNDSLEKQITELKTSVGAQLKKVSESTSAQIKAIETRLNDKIFDIEYTLVEFEIESHRSKNQVGEISMMIIKLGMDLKRGWGAEDSLLEIREYIKKQGMPNYYLSELTTKIKVVPESFKPLGEEILKLAQERLYNPRG
jgi:Ca2+/Na+ antiporter